MTRTTALNETAAISNKQTNHTSGPWRFVGFETPDPSKGIEGRGGRQIATVIGQGAETNTANARLISAAPDLLAAALLATQDCFIGEELTNHGCTMKGHAALRAAIAKAREESK